LFSSGLGTLNFGFFAEPKRIRKKRPASKKVRKTKDPKRLLSKSGIPPTPEIVSTVGGISELIQPQSLKPCVYPLFSANKPVA